MYIRTSLTIKDSQGKNRQIQSLVEEECLDQEEIDEMINKKRAAATAQIKKNLINISCGYYTTKQEVLSMQTTPKSKKVPVSCYILGSDYKVIGSISTNVSIEDIIKELERVKQEETYIIKRVKNDDSRVDIGFDEGCLNQLISLVNAGDLSRYQSERYPNGKSLHLLEFRFVHGKAQWSIAEQKKPVEQVV